MQIVRITGNPLRLGSWVEHRVDNVIDLLMTEFITWPETARIYDREISVSTDITPHSDESIEYLLSLPGPLLVVVYPGLANIAAAAAIYAVAYVVTSLIGNDTKKPREQIFGTGSANNSLSKRSNEARLNQRIPDIFGTVRSVPDLIQWPYQIYENDVLIEYTYSCIGRGSYAISDVRDGDTLISEINGASINVYPPGQAPGGGSPDLIIGGAITENIYVINTVKQVSEQLLSPINIYYIYGSGVNANGAMPIGPATEPTFDIGQGTRVSSISGISGIVGNKAHGDGWVKASFLYLGSGVGIIRVPTNGDFAGLLNICDVGDELQVIWSPVPTTANPKPDLSAGWSFGVQRTGYTPGTRGAPALRGDLDPLVVTDIVELNSAIATITVSIPLSQQPEWDKIEPYVGVGNELYNRDIIVCAQNRWPFGYILNQSTSNYGQIINDPLMTELWMTFSAPDNINLDDNVNRISFTATIAFFIVPVDQSGTPTGDPTESGTVELVGSILTGDKRGITYKHIRNTVGRCRIIVCVTSFIPRSKDLFALVSGFYRNLVIQSIDNAVIPELTDIASNGVGPYTGTINCNVEFSSCYSVSPVVNFNNSDITTIHTRTVSNRFTSALKDRQLNCLASRQVNTWNGSSFGPPADTQDLGENMLFHIATDAFIGNMDINEIDFAGIANSFSEIRDYFGDIQATQFSYTFDDFNTSFEETISILCQACFATPYRLGNKLKVDPDIANDGSSGLFNHRNKLPGSETRTITFGLVGDNDGVEQSFININTGPDTYTPIPQTNDQSSIISPLKSRIVGLKTKLQAAWQAYRQQAIIQHQHIGIEFEALEEAAPLSLRNRILVEDNTRPDVQDGEITYVSGLVVGTSQPVVFAGGATYTAFLQLNDGSVQPIPATVGPDGRSFTLGTAPATPLVTDPALGVPTGYMLSRNQSTQSKAFLITDKQHNSIMTYGISAINYSHMYYHADGLILYIPVSTASGVARPFDDFSPIGNPNNGNIINLTSDALRGPVYIGNVLSPGILVDSNITPSLLNGYTKMCWIYKTATTGVGSILSSTSTGDEHFETSGSVVLRAGHNNLVHVFTSSFSINVWHHVAVTYSVPLGQMILYLDGEIVASALSVPNRVNSSLTAFNSVFTLKGPHIGSADNLRHYCRVLSPAMVRETYQKELIVP